MLKTKNLFSNKGVTQNKKHHQTLTNVYNFLALAIMLFFCVVTLQLTEAKLIFNINVK
jgi:hypothetical protein